MKEKNYTQSELDEYVRNLLTNSEIALSKQNEKIEKMKRENEVLQKELDEYKKKEKSISRLLILSERKAKFLETNTRSRCIMEIERLARLVERWDEFFSSLDNKYNAADKARLNEFKNEISKTIDGMLNMENLFSGQPLSEAEKAHESEVNRLNVIKDKKQVEIDNRFSKLLKEFNMKIGDNASRGRGRPKKDDPSNVKTIEKKLKKSSREQTVYPPVGDSGFDFEEALNPVESLEDIMKDLMGSNEN